MLGGEDLSACVQAKRRRTREPPPPISDIIVHLRGQHRFNMEHASGRGFAVPMPSDPVDRAAPNIGSDVLWVDPIEVFGDFTS